MEQPEAVQPSGRELATVGVQGQIAVTSDALAALDERAAAARLAEAERFEPDQREEAEAVVELRAVDVGGGEIAARPQVRGRVRAARPSSVW